MPTTWRNGRNGITLTQRLSTARFLPSHLKIQVRPGQCICRLEGFARLTCTRHDVVGTRESLCKVYNDYLPSFPKVIICTSKEIKTVSRNFNLPMFVVFSPGTVSISSTIFQVADVKVKHS